MISLFTTIPVPSSWQTDDLASSLRWAPIVGAAIGAVAGVFGTILWFVGFPATVVAGLTLALLVLLTGALHEDGLADLADGFWGGEDEAERLSIMRDSSIGAYGGIAISLSLLLRWACLTQLVSDNLVFVALVAVGAVSRCSIVLAMRFIENAIGDGLSAAVGKPSIPDVSVGSGLTFILVILTVGIGGVPHLLLGLVPGAALCWLAIRKIGGQTGDVLGALQQIVEIGCLCFLTLKYT